MVHGIQAAALSTNGRCSLRKEESVPWRWAVQSTECPQVSVEEPCGEWSWNRPSQNGLLGFLTLSRLNFNAYTYHILGCTLTKLFASRAVS
jgi:hypothetical protein